MFTHWTKHRRIVFVSRKLCVQKQKRCEMSMAAKEYEERMGNETEQIGSNQWVMLSNLDFILL